MEASMAPTNGGTLCIPCGKVLSNVHKFKRHFRDHHSFTNQQYSCPSCQRIYKNRSSMASHIASKHKDMKGVNLEVFKI